jgi:molecular chaperone IbpA
MADPKSPVSFGPQELLKFAIGMEQHWSIPANLGSFPPHNIEKLDEDRYILTLAVAGFRRDEIDISLFRGYLRIEGKKISVDKDELRTMTTLAGLPEAEFEPTPTILYQGIAFRDFAREFKLGEDVEVTSAHLQDGLLRVHLNRIKLKEEKPVIIPIR